MAVETLAENETANGFYPDANGVTPGNTAFTLQVQGYFDTGEQVLQTLIAGDVWVDAAVFNGPQVGNMKVGAAMKIRVEFRKCSALTVMSAYYNV